MPDSIKEHAVDSNVDLFAQILPPAMDTTV